LKSKSAAVLKRAFADIERRIIKYGSSKNVQKHSQEVMKTRILSQKSKFVLLQEDAIMRVWNQIMIFVLLYVGLWMPYNICFNPLWNVNGMTFADYIDAFVEVLFLIDIVINFMCAYEDPKTG
jgi:hypothetical protein